MSSLRTLAAATFALCLPASLSAEVSLPSIFGSHMVLQREHANPVWGWAKPGEAITVSIGDQRHSTKADSEGDWRVELKPMQAGGPHVMKVAGENDVTFEDVLVGEVWICSGQSNMAWPVANAYDGDLVAKSANDPGIRIISVPQVGTQEPQKDFNGKWEVCTGENVGQFSAVGYFFGKRLHDALGVPVGLIDNAWGGSAAEAWVNRERLEADGVLAPLFDHWASVENTYDFEKLKAAYEKRLATWQEKAKAAREAGKPVPPRPRGPRNLLTGNQRPANIYNGVLKPTIGYGIRGAIWYQGESNASRAAQYRHLFPLMIQSWRDEWKQGDFPFYWVQLADFRDEKSEPGDSDWAELREAQTMTMQKLPNTGQAVIIDVGEGRDIHPRDKRTVGERLARWALAKDYGIDLVHRSPQYTSMTVEGNKVRLKFDTYGSRLYSFDVREPIGLTIAGKDKQFVPAKGRIVGNDTIEVWSDEVTEPAAVRYAWADNPVANLRNAHGLPVTPFRTDEWPGVTDGVHHR